MIQTFPFVKGLLETLLADRNFAIVIDEAHTSRSGRTAEELMEVLSEGSQVTAKDELNSQDIVNEVVESSVALEQQIATETEASAGARNVSLRAFTATPKSRTKFLLGRENDDGKPVSFNVCPMRQAIDEGLISDVLCGYQTDRTTCEIEKRDDGQLAAALQIGSAGDEADRFVAPQVATRKIMRFGNLHPTNVGGERRETGSAIFRTMARTYELSSCAVQWSRTGRPGLRPRSVPAGG